MRVQANENANDTHYPAAHAITPMPSHREGATIAIMPDFLRKRLPHDVPHWIDPTQETFFVTIVCQPRGNNQLANHAIWSALLESIEHRENRSDWSWKIILAMPDHLHGIVIFPQRFHLGKTLSDWKRWTATKHGIHWQNGFFDHRLRSSEGAAEKARYIRMNPVRAGLITQPGDWPFIRDWKTG